MQMIDGYGTPVRLVVVGAFERPMAKAVGGDPNTVQFNLGAYRFTWLRKGPIGVLTCMSDTLALPFHTVVSSAAQVKQAAQELVRDFNSGKTPPRGVFRQMQVPVARYTPA